MYNRKEDDNPPFNIPESVVCQRIALHWKAGVVMMWTSTFKKQRFGWHSWTDDNENDWKSPLAKLGLFKNRTAAYIFLKHTSTE